MRPLIVAAPQCLPAVGCSGACPRGAASRVAIVVVSPAKREGLAASGGGGSCWAGRGGAGLVEAGAAVVVASRSACAWGMSALLRSLQDRFRRPPAVVPVMDDTLDEAA